MRDREAHNRDAARDVRADMSGIDAKTAQRLLTEYMPMVRAIARTYYIDQDELLTVGQIAIMEAFVSYKEDADASEKTWVRKVVRWRMKGAVWREMSATDPELFVQDEALTNGKHDPERNTLRNTLRSAAERLSPRHRTIIDARMRGETYAEIGESLGISTARVHKEAQRAYQELREWAEDGV